jgi:hypothetical protein
LGRFINRDPIEEQGGLNLYAFVRNNAVNAWDYLGMWPFDSVNIAADGGGSPSDEPWRMPVFPVEGRKVPFAPAVITDRNDIEQFLNDLKNQLLIKVGLGGGFATASAEPKAKDKPERWSDEKCAALAAQIEEQRSSLHAFRDRNGGSYLNEPGLAESHGQAELERLYPGSAADWVSQGVGWAGVASVTAELAARRIGGATAVEAVDAAGTIVSGVSHPTNLGLAGNELNQRDGLGAVGSFAGAAGDITSIVLTGARAAPGFGWLLAVGSAAIFVTENVATAGIQSSARSDIVAHFSRLAAIEAGAANRISENQAVHDKHCK